MNRRPVPLSLLLIVTALAVAPVDAAVELYLTDGQVVRGKDIELEDGNYLIEDGQGQVVAIPVGLVARLAFVGEPEPDPQPAEEAETEEAAENADADSFTREEPRVLAGIEVVPPRRSEQLEALGEPSRFPRDLVDNRWRPEGDWPEQGGTDFAPTRWPRDLIDPNWSPTSGFPSTDALDGRAARWQRGVVDSTWVPVDGFRGGF